MKTWLSIGLLAAVCLLAAPFAARVAAGEGAAAEPPAITFVDDGDDEEGQGGSSPVNPFGTTKEAVSRKDAVPGYLSLSSDLKVPGRIYTTRAKRLKVFNLKRNLYEYVPVPAIKRMEVSIDWERLDKEWRFKDAGNPEKVYTGRSYPARQLAWRIILRNDHEILGHILGQPLYVEHNGKAERFLLSKRQKGPMGSSLQDLLYINAVVFGAEAYNQAVEELKQKAEAAETEPAPAKLTP